MIMTLIEHLLCARPYVKHLSCWDRYYIPHFIDEKTEAQRVKWVDQDDIAVK